MNINITIADILVQMQSPLSAAELGMEKRLGPFFGASRKPSSRVSLCWEESPGVPRAHGELIYDPGAIWKMYRSGQEYYAEINYKVDGSWEESVQGVLRVNTTWDKLTLTERRINGAGWQSLLNLGAGELIMRSAILFTDGLVFHASGLDDNGRGVVFAGHAGAGKSTHLGLWSSLPGVIAMNDDRVAVRANACYGLPWGGTSDIARNHKAPLSAIILLEQAPENEIRPLPPSAAAPLLLARAFLPHWEPSLMQRAFENLNKILASVPVYRLRCRPEPAVVLLVRSVL